MVLKTRYQLYTFTSKTSVHLIIKMQAYVYNTDSTHFNKTNYALTPTIII